MSTTVIDHARAMLARDEEFQRRAEADPHHELDHELRQLALRRFRLMRAAVLALLDEVGAVEVSRTSQQIQDMNAALAAMTREFVLEGSAPDDELLQAAHRVVSCTWGTSVSEQYHYERVSLMNALREAVRRASAEKEKP